MQQKLNQPAIASDERCVDECVVGLTLWLTIFCSFLLTKNNITVSTTKITCFEGLLVFDLLSPRSAISNLLCEPLAHGTPRFQSIRCFSDNKLDHQQTSTMRVIRPMLPEEQEEMVDLLVRAFETDPLGQWLFPDVSVRHEKHAALFRTAIEESVIVDVCDDKSGIAIWKKVEDVSERQFEDPDDEPPAAQFFRMVDDNAPSAPYFYLSFLAVDPLKKGTGAGGALLQHRLPLLDNKVALWTANEVNLTFYEKYGFKLHAKCPFDVGACAWWFVKE